MNVYITFDIEIWCNTWTDLDAVFPAAFDRYVYGRSMHGEFALPQTLRILNRHGLPGTFFVEPMFASRFGPRPLRTVVGLIRDAGHEVQLHLHPEWTNESVEPIIANCAAKRQHLTHYDVDEQTALIAWSRNALEAAGSGTVRAFRAGSFAANRATFTALRRNGIRIDTSLNRCYAISGPDFSMAERNSDVPVSIEGVTTLPVAVFRDGFGYHRSAQVNGSGFFELKQALHNAHALGRQHFVIVSHNYEMLRPGTTEPDWYIVRRFDALCAYLAENRDRYTVRGFHNLDVDAFASEPHGVPTVGFAATTHRYAEQALRRLAPWAATHKGASEELSHSTPARPERSEG